MNEKDFKKALDYARGLSKKRKFEQSVELILNFKGIDFKKADNRIDIDVKLPHVTGKQGNAKVLVFAKDKLFASEVKDTVAKVIMDTEIPNLKKKDVDALIKEYNIFLAEGPAILSVGKYIGQQLAPKGRMPKPVQNTVQSVEQALKTVSTFTKITNKKGKFMPVAHVMIGKENSKEEELLANILAVYNPLIEALPNKEGNIKSVILKFSMGKPIKVGENYDSVKAQVKEEAK